MKAGEPIVDKWTAWACVGATMWMDALKTVTSGSRRFWKLHWGKRKRPFRQYLCELRRTLLHPNCQPLHARAQLLSNRHRPPLRGWAWPTPLPTRGPPRPGHTSCHTSHHDAITIWCDAGASAGPPWQSRPGSLGQPARLHRRRAARRLNRRARAKAQLSTRLAVHVRYNSTWSPTALSSAVTAFRCLDGYDRHKEPPTPFGGRAASSSQIEIHLNSSHARGARARTVPTVSGDAILKALVQACRPRSIRRSPSWCTWSVVWRDRGRSASGAGRRAARGASFCILVRLWCIEPARANVMRFR